MRHNLNLPGPKTEFNWFFLFLRDSFPFNMVLNSENQVFQRNVEKNVALQIEKFSFGLWTCHLWSTNSSFNQKIESVLYKAALAITIAIQGLSRTKLHQEVELQSLEMPRWYRKLLIIRNYKSKTPSLE